MDNYDDVGELEHPMFDPEMTDLIKKHREEHLDTQLGLIQAIAIDDIVGAIDSYTEMYSDSLMLFGLIAEMQEDNDPHGDWAEMVIKEFEDRNALCLDYIHDYLRAAGLKVDSASTAEEIQERIIKHQNRSDEERRKLDQAEAKFNEWKAQRNS